MKILGIYREEMFSNRAVMADRKILEQVLICIRKALNDRCHIQTITPEDLSLIVLDFHYDLILSMAQDESVLTLLDLYEARGAVVLNSSRSIRNCYRQKLSELLSGLHFNYPSYFTIDLKNYRSNQLGNEGVWIKRGDFHALIDDDVVYAGDRDEQVIALEQFQKRGVNQVILQEHCEGELFKFYGVRDKYFHLRYMGFTGKNRYSFVDGNDNVAFDRERAEELAHRAARVLDLDFFGGDFIVTSEGEVSFIDFNDWPSFRSCVDDAAPIMAEYAIDKIQTEVGHAYSTL